jgi:hypothetical protein
MCITVTTQEELVLALEDGGCIHIESPAGVWLSLRASDSATVRASDSATVRASDSATVRAYGSATVEAYGSATVEAYDSATVRAYDSATVRAYGSATVQAYDSATVQAYGSATVRASGSATVQASGSATVEASGSATVQAYGSATVRAYGSATVRAYGSATVEAYGSATVEASGSATVEASGSATVQAYDSATVQASTQVAVHLHSAKAKVSGGVLMDLTKLDLTDPATWCGHHGVKIADGMAALYKALGNDLVAGQQHGNPYTYEVGAELVCADWRDDHSCGGGLHLGPTPFQAGKYHSNPTRWMRCMTPLESLRPILGDWPKCKVERLTVVAEVDSFGRDIAKQPES